MPLSSGMLRNSYISINKLFKYAFYYTLYFNYESLLIEKGMIHFYKKKRRYDNEL